MNMANTASAERDMASLPSALTGAEKAPAKILVVEDNDVTRELLAMLLKRRGYEVETAGDGEEGLNKLLANTYHACVTDYHLPKIDGVEMVKSLRKLAEPGQSTPRFIGMTNDIEGLLSHPGDCEILDLVFSKPIVASEVYTAIETEAPHVRSIAHASKRQSAEVNQVKAAASAIQTNPILGEDYDERRRAIRKIVSINGTKVVTATGQSGECRIVNMSIYGAAIATKLKLRVGERVTVGRSQAKIVRISGEGEYGIEFASN